MWEKMGDGVTPATKVLHVVIPGQPVAKGRPRMSKTGRVYAAPKSKAWEDTSAMVISAKWRAPATSRPIALSVLALFRRPKGMSGIERVPHTKRPDLDNIVKAVMDAVNKSGVWIDDCQVYRLDAQAWYCAAGEEPRVEVRISG